MTFSRVNRDMMLRYVTGLQKLLNKHKTATALQIDDPADIQLINRAWADIQKGMAAITDSLSKVGAAQPKKGAR